MKSFQNGFEMEANFGNILPNFWVNLLHYPKNLGNRFKPWQKIKFMLNQRQSIYRFIVLFFGMDETVTHRFSRTLIRSWKTILDSTDSFGKIFIDLSDDILKIPDLMAQHDKEIKKDKKNVRWRRICFILEIHSSEISWYRMEKNCLNCFIKMNWVSQRLNLNLKNWLSKKTLQRRNTTKHEKLNKPMSFRRCFSFYFFLAFLHWKECFSVREKSWCRSESRRKSRERICQSYWSFACHSAKSYSQRNAKSSFGKDF